MSKTITIDGTEYIPKSEANTQSKEMAKKLKGLEYVIVRTYSAGVFAGYLKERNGKEGVVLQARRLWYWDGAASLSELAMSGVSKPENCKFPEEVTQIILTEIVEVLSVTEEARLNIKNVPTWKA